MLTVEWDRLGFGLQWQLPALVTTDGMCAELRAGAAARGAAAGGLAGWGLLRGEK